MKRVVLLAALLMATGAQGADKGMAERMGEAAFDAVERELIRGYFEKRPDIVEEVFGAYREEEEGLEDRAGKEKKGKKDKGAKGKGRGDGLPPGLAKREKLPPGLSRKLERDGRLPPGLESRSLPADLERSLPPPPAGSERVVVGADVVLIEKASGVIQDILRDVLGTKR